MICSDGVTKHVSDDQIAEILRQETTAKSACNRLIETANSAGGSDNITVVLQRSADNETLLNQITVTRKAKNKQPLDIEAEAARITGTWSVGEDGKPVCATRQGPYKGKAIFGECVVRDLSNQIALFSVNIVPMQVIHTLTHVPRKEK